MFVLGDTVSCSVNCNVYTHNIIIFLIILLSRGVKEFISRFPQHTNLPKDDGYTALHLAALNDNGDVVTLLAQEVIHAKYVQMCHDSSYIRMCKHDDAV